MIQMQCVSYGNGYWDNIYLVSVSIDNRIQGHLIDKYRKSLDSQNEYFSSFKRLKLWPCIVLYSPPYANKPSLCVVRIDVMEQFFQVFIWQDSIAKKCLEFV